MDWYKDLSKEQHAEVLAYAIGYLEATVKTGPCDSDKELIQNYAGRLLGHLEEEIHNKISQKKGLIEHEMPCM